MGHESTTLSLKYRPKTLGQFIGNSEVKGVIKGMIDSRQVPRAVMLIGPPGTGKTTLSRLLLKYFNCDTFNACGKCPSCLALRGDEHPDYTEVNASEAGNIDDIRTLIKNSRYKPTHNLKVICLDECHRMSNAASNALLKPLEEPPPSTMWVLATTDPDKIPNHSAIMSRCLVLNLNTTDLKTVAKHVVRVGKAEKFDWLDTAGAKQIATASTGHVRSALQLLEMTARYVESKDGELDTTIDKIVGKLSIQLAEGDVDKFALMGLLALYEGDMKGLMRTVLGIEKDKFIQLTSKMLYANVYAMTQFSIGRHKAVWSTKMHQALVKGLQDKEVYTDEIGLYIHDQLTDLSNALKSTYGVTDDLTALKYMGRVIAQHQGDG